MPCCAASHCCNRELGVRLFRFPRDEARKDVWRIFCDRGDWVPTKNHKLCEKHFDTDQFDETAVTSQGNRKLKPAAIPTLIDTTPKSDNVKLLRKLRKMNKEAAGLITVPTTSKKSPKKKDQKATQKQVKLPEPEISPKSKRSMFVLMIPSGPNNKKMGIVIKGKKDFEKVKKLYGNKPLPPLQHIKMKSNKFNEIKNQVSQNKLKVSDLANDKLDLNKVKFGRMPQQRLTLSVRENYERKIRMLSSTNNMLRKKLSKANLQLYVQSTNIHKIFTHDQIEVLSQYHKRLVIWSDETKKRSAQIRLACGHKGYRQLRKIGFPLPTVRELIKTTDNNPAAAVRAALGVTKPTLGLVECNVEITEGNEDLLTY